MMPHTPNRLAAGAALVATILTPYLLAQQAHSAEVISEANGSDGNTIALFRERGPCVAPALSAQYIAKNGDVTPGCWVVGSLRSLRIVFFDGDFIELPVDAFKAPKKT